jgi:hypothetical protein
MNIDWAAIQYSVVDYVVKMGSHCGASVVKAGCAAFTIIVSGASRKLHPFQSFHAAVKLHA